MIQIDYFGGTSSDDDVNLCHSSDSRSYDLRTIAFPVSDYPQILVAPCSYSSGHITNCLGIFLFSAWTKDLSD